MSLKHSNGVIPCPLCEEKLKQAHPDLSSWFNDVVKPGFDDCHVSWSFRDKDSQDDAYATGKSKLKWPNSKHNTVDDQGNPLAHAIDLFELDSSGMAKWSWKYFNEVAAVMPTTMQWGGNWKSIGDSDHFELI